MSDSFFSLHSRHLFSGQPSKTRSVPFRQPNSGNMTNRFLAEQSFALSSRLLVNKCARYQQACVCIWFSQSATGLTKTNQTNLHESIYHIHIWCSKYTVVIFIIIHYYCCFYDVSDGGTFLTVNEWDEGNTPHNVNE